MTPYLHQNYAVVRKCAIWCYFGQIFIIFGSNLVSKFEKFIPELRLFMVLFDENLLSNINNKG